MIVDTNALSAFVEGEATVGEALARATRVAIPVVVLGEYRYGIELSRHRAAYESWLTTHLRAFEVLAVTERTALEYAKVRLALKRLGRPIPANDAWIAALARQHGLPVLSRDAHFDVVPGVERRAF